MKASEVCAECSKNCLLIHGQKKGPSPPVISFLKVMFGNYDVSNYLYLPPKFVRTFSKLVDQREYYLEDSSGQRWAVTLSIIKGNFAFQKGWHKFFEDHSLKVGDALIFNYIVGSHFVVHIYGKTGCQKFNFSESNGNQRKKRRTKVNFLGEDEPNQIIDSANKQSSNTTVVSGSDIGSQSQPIRVDKNPKFENGKGLQVALAIEHDIEQVYMIDRDTGYYQGEDRSCLYDLSNFEMKSTRIDVDETNKAPVTVEKSSHPSDVLKSQSAVDILNKNRVVTAVARRWVSPLEVSNLAKNEKNTDSSLRDKVVLMEKAHQDGLLSGLALEKSSAEPRGKRIYCESRSKTVKSREAEARNTCSRKDPNILNELVQSCCMAEMDDDGVFKVVKAEPVDPSSSNPFNSSCLAVMESQAFLELPECLPSISFRRAKMERKVVNLRGPDARLWPVLYHEKFGLKVLASGWEGFCKSNSIQPGDECVFGLENEAESIYRVNIVRKADGF